MTACINLNERFGDQCRVEYEKSYYAERGEHGRLEDPWLMIIPCQRGHIYPHGRELLAASTNTRGGIARKLAALDCTSVIQDGSDGINATFHVRDFERVAELMKPKRRRRLSPEHRQKLVEAGKASRFQGQTHGTQHAPDDRRRAQAVSRDTLDVPA